MKQVIVVMGDDGMPLQALPKMGIEQGNALSRQADLYAAFQWGGEAAKRCNVEGERIKFLEKYGNEDKEAQSEFDRGANCIQANG